MTSSPGAIRCSSCGKENFAFVSFCHACGEPLHDAGDDDFAPESSVSTGQKQSTVPHPGANSARQWVRWESGLGFLILLLTIGYALVSWKQSNEQADAYHQGIAAEQQRNWDKALTQFTKAGDTQDSPRRKSEAASKVIERNIVYSRGVSAMDQENWVRALSMFTHVQQIQPGYRDTDERQKYTTEQATLNGLNGLIYLVSYGDEPGLYIRDRHGHAILLPGSDKNSTVRALDSTRKLIVYDRPSRELDYLGPTINHNSMVPDPFGPAKTDRIPALAETKPDGTIVTTPLPRLDPGGMGVFADKGLWWFSAQPGAEVFGYEVFYTADLTGDGPFAQPVRVSDIQNNRRVVAVDPPRSRVIISETRGDQRSGNRQTLIYLAGAAGDAPRTVGIMQGDLLQVSVSDDGRRLLFITQEVTGGNISRTVWVVPLDVGIPYSLSFYRPVRLQALSWEGLQMDVHLTATFVPQPEPYGKNLPGVIVDIVDHSVESLTMHDLTTFLPTTLWEGEPLGAYGWSVAGFSQNGALLASRRQSGRSSSLEIMGLKPGSGAPTDVGVPSYPDQIFKVQFSPNGDYVLASVQSRDGINRGTTQTLYSLPVDSEGKPQADGLKRIAFPNLPYEQDLSPVAVPASGYLLAYVTASKDLHSVFLDGTNDTLLAKNVEAVWSLQAAPDRSWAR